MKIICTKTLIHIYSFLLLTSCFSLIYAQAPDTLWTKKYDGDDSEDKSYSVQQTNDGGYIVVGYKTYYATVEDVCLLKTDSDGNVQWEKIYGGDNQDIGRAVAQTSDGGYIVTGSTMSFGYNYCDAWLLKTDENGDTTWTRRYGWTNADVNGYSVQQTTDGGYIIGGYETSHMILIKTDSVGDTLWLREYGTSGLSRGFSVQQTTDGGYITAGWYGYFFYLVKTDEFGDTLWSTQIGSGAYDRLYSVIQTHDGGYLATGGFAMPYDNRSSDVGLMKTDSLGTIEWFYTYGNSIRSDVGYSVIETSNKEFVVAGSTHPDTSDYYNTYLLKTDTLGNEIWSTQYPGYGEDWGHCVQETSDGGYIIAGWVSGSGGWGDIRLIKTAPDTLDVKEQIVNPVKITDFGTTVFCGPLLLPEGKNCKVFDITGRVVMPDKIKPGIYFIEVDGRIQQKIIKVK